jgi:hypothetical protein
VAARLAAFALVGLLTGCASALSDVSVPVDLAQAVPRAGRVLRRAEVRVTDIRR